MKESDFVSIWLEESGNPAIEEITMANQETVNKIKNFLLEKELNSADLSAMLDINHSEIVRWLTGIHAFSIKKLKEMLCLLEDFELDHSDRKLT